MARAWPRAEEFSARLGLWPFYFQLENWKSNKTSQIFIISHIRIGTLFTSFLVFVRQFFFPWNEKCKRKVLSKKKKTKYWQLRFSSKIEAPQLGSTRNLFSSRNFSSNSLQPSTEQAQGCLTSVIQREFQKYFDSIVKEEGKRL